MVIQEELKSFLVKAKKAMYASGEEIITKDGEEFIKPNTSEA